MMRPAMHVLTRGKAPHHGIMALCVALLLSVCATGALAQSGRKQKKSTPEPPPQGVKIPEEKPAEDTKGHSDSDAADPDAEKEKGPARRFLVGVEMPDMYVPMYYTDLARSGCVRELRTNPLMQVMESQTMTRGEAIQIAKKEENTWVVVLELRADQFSGGDGFSLMFSVFEPKTARIIASGYGYPVSQAGGIPLPPMGSSRVEYRVQLAGMDAGRRIREMVRAKLPPPPPKKPTPFQASTAGK
ncbi:MAG: hypothetical protein ACKV2V_02155 [Blastocatellia bacterium]